MNHRDVLFFLLCLPLLLKAEYSWERSPAEPIVQDGVHALYNYDFDNSVILLDSARHIDAFHPVIPFVLIAAKWLKTQTEEGYDASYNMINVEGKTIMPGIIDMHAHHYRENRGHRPPNDYEVALYLAYGITTNLDNSMWAENIFPWMH